MHTSNQNSVEDNLSPVIFIAGPTAIGKTDLALSLCEHMPAEIVSVDSVQVYRQLNIGSAKPSVDILRRIPHWLIDIMDPAEPYSVAKFLMDACCAIQEITGRGKVPLLVGGSMMYFNTLLNGLSKLPASDSVVRKDLEQQIERRGVEQLYAELEQVDAETARMLHPNQQQRILRALEVFRTTGVPISSLRGGLYKQVLPSCYTVYQFGLVPSDRKFLHRKIETRFRSMIACGLCEEVQRLYLRGDLNKDLPAIRSAGYRQLWEFFEGNLSLDAAVDRGIIATRQLAKRQLTWMRRWTNMQMLRIDDGTKFNHPKKIVQTCLKILSKTPFSF